MKKKAQAPAKPTKNSHPSTSSAKLAAFGEHIRELRRRILWVALVFVLAGSLAYSYHGQLVQLVMQPLDGQKLIYLTPGGGFSFIFQITLYAGLIAAGPMLMYQLYAFVRPALPAHARRSATKVVSVAAALMLTGVSYGYFIAVPAALKFLSNFAGSNVLPSLTADSYLNFFLSYVAGLGLLFQLPLLLMFWHWIKPMTPGGLLKSERFIILFAFVAAALITPTPDIVNQAMIAVPLILIYQGGVAAVLWAILRRKSHAHGGSTAVTVAAALTVPATPTADDPKRPVPSLTSALPVAASTSLVQPAHSRTRRSIDGMMSRQRSLLSQPNRPLQVPERTPAQTMPRRRTLLSIDGISSM